MKQPRLVVAGIPIKNGNVLLTKRAREPFKNHWAFSGGCGAFEKTSDPVEAVKLEVKFDTNCEFKPQFYIYSYADFNGPTATLFFTGHIKGNPLAINPEYTSECKWFPLKEANKLQLAFEHNAILRKIIAEETSNENH